MDFDRFSLWPIFVYHYRALVRPGCRFLSLTTVLVLFLLPLGAAGFSVHAGALIPSSALGPLLAASGLLVGAAISCFVLLTNLRIKLKETEEWSYRSKVTKLVGGTAASALYTACLAMAMVLGLVAGISIPVLHQGIPRLIGSGLVVLIGLHIVATLMTVLRRIFGVYYGLFSADFSPSLKGLSSPDLKDRKDAA